MDQDKMIKIYARSDSRIQLKMIPGHFVTSQSHITHYLDLTTMKSRCAEAQRIASALAANYEASIPVDTIVCMDGLEVIGAYLAETLSQNGITSMNQHKSIYVVTPEVHSSGQLIFRDNLQPMIEGKHVLLLIASATTGKTIKKSLECIKYYGGSIAGISAIFSVATEVDGYPVHALFTEKDLPDYKTYPHDQCPMCQAGNRIEAIVNSYGYSEL